MGFPPENVSIASTFLGSSAFVYVSMAASCVIKVVFFVSMCLCRFTVMLPGVGYPHPDTNSCLFAEFRLTFAISFYRTCRIYLSVWGHSIATIAMLLQCRVVTRMNK